ncbi:MAG: metallophosphoesterase [Chloroflexota bacterium]
MCLVLTGGLGYLYANHIEPQWVEVKHIRLLLAQLPESFAQYRVVQISDLHMDYSLNAERLRPIVAMINAQKPDMVTITGDFANNIARFKQAIPVFKQLKAKDGVFGVLGNHDHWGDFAPQVREILRESGVQELRNQVVTIQREEAQLHIAGVDDILKGEPDLDRVVNQLPASGAAILLAHEPDYADLSATTGRFALQLSGHTHGGQVSVPLYGPPKVPKMGEKYPVGLYQIGSMQLYTNRGLGVLPSTRVRFNARPEITVFTLMPPA